ncbi:MAG: DMT family transporter [Pseudomonadales bacterium]
MSPGALALVLAAAVCHAGWNYFAKRSAGDALFVWLCALVSVVLYLPVAAFVMYSVGGHLSAWQAAFMAGSAVLHVGYFLLLQAGYRHGDLSLVYPLARATGPVVAVAAAVLLLGEQPGMTAVAGMVLLVLGVFFLARPGRGSGRLVATADGSRAPAVVFGLGTGVLIGTYTLWDAHAVASALVPPLLLDYAANLGRAVLLGPYALRRRGDVPAAWRRHRVDALAVGLLSPLAYILVLSALQFTPVSYVAPAREVSVLVAVVMGGRLLRERDAGRRLLWAALMLIGLALVALG